MGIGWGDVWNGTKRVAGAVATGGLSEAGGVKTLADTGILPEQIIPKPADLPEDTAAKADAAAGRAAGVADQAHQNLVDAEGRRTTPTTIDPATAARTDVGATPLNPGQTVQHAGATAAPTIAPVNPVVAGHVITPDSTQNLGARTAGSSTAEQANRTTLQVDQGGREYQNQAAAAMAATLRGEQPSLAQLQGREAMDRAAAEQLSIAAGARGQGVASARRNAANNISLAQVQAGGQAAQLRAKEIADAAAGLATSGTQIQGQSGQEATARAQLEQTTELTNTKARNDAIQASQERFARGEITQAQLDADIAKANADYQQRTGEKNADTQKDVAIEHSRQQLQADLASDERLQQSFNLQAQLQAQAAAGNQDAQVRLQALQAQLNADVDKFNANQVNTINSQNVQNRLTALHLDDTFTAQMSQQWIEAEKAGNQAAMDAIKTKINAALAKASADQAWRKEIFTDISDGFSAAAKLSDRRLKKDIKEVSPAAVDEFLRTVGANKTWRYTDPGHGEGDQVGPMAQDVERSELGRAAVTRRPDGMRTVDYQRMAALALAGLGRVSDRLDQVEGKKGKAPPDEAGFLRARRGKAA